MAWSYAEDSPWNCCHRHRSSTLCKLDRCILCAARETRLASAYFCNRNPSPYRRKSMRNGPQWNTSRHFCVKKGVREREGKREDVATLFICSPPVKLGHRVTRARKRPLLGWVDPFLGPLH
ncbi:hypothetical protein ALC53_05480 [Atta colombica]|uniref:Uncharacterized protein n=1 Tax=Atta colombica TaxID=520822 RepID=A0A195BIF9_9HYME|nr:hypothetical protein ALC53_05480 [Atta colombica]